ncbi:hypothetical protein [Alistipes timonensis]
MKNIVYLFLFAVTFSRCSQAPVIDVADVRFKDSIILADGNKLLGNICFGVDQDEFYDQKTLFLEQQHDSIYGYYIHDIIPAYTREHRLYAVTFVCSIYRDYKPEEWPFRDFCLKKFGKEKPHEINHWNVGDRNISVIREMRKRGFHYALRCLHENSIIDPATEEVHFTIDQNEKFNYYCLYIESDSMKTRDRRQEQEYYDTFRREDEQRKKALEIHTGESKKMTCRNCKSDHQKRTTFHILMD